VGVAGLRPQVRGVREAAAAGVAEVLHDGRQRAADSGRHVQPALDRRPAEAGERDVVGVDDGELVVDRRERGGQVVGARLLEGTAPEVDQVSGHGHVGPVLTELVEGKVEHGHEQQTYAHPADPGKRYPMLDTFPLG
jgi:hypothetical protein